MPRGRAIPISGSARARTLPNAPAGPPLIRGFSPPAAAGGEIVSLTGTGFARTTEVRFLGRHGRFARGRVPHHLGSRAHGGSARRRGRQAHGPQLLAVATTEGLAVTVPRHQTIRPGILPPFRRQSGVVSRRTCLDQFRRYRQLREQPIDFHFPWRTGHSGRRRTALTSSSMTADWAMPAEIRTPSSLSPARSFPIGSNALRSGSRSAIIIPSPVDRAVRHSAYASRSSVMSRSPSPACSCR